MDSGWQKKTADSFWLAAARCFEQRRSAPTEFQMLLIPGVVCMALSIELGIKTILAKTGKPPRTHDLEKLFRALPSQMQQELVAACNIPRASFEHELRGVAKSFEEWRYVYELEQPQINLPFLSQLADAIRLSTDKDAL